MKKNTPAASGTPGSNNRSATASKAAKANTNAKDTAKDDNHGESLLEKFFLDQLKDIYYAENKILKALPSMEEACTTEELKEAFSDHRHQTEKHVKRLEKVFQLLGQKPEAKKCE